MDKSDLRNKIVYGDIKMKIEKGKIWFFLDLMYKCSECLECFICFIKVKD